MPDKPQFILIGVGELLWDCFGEERKPGGAPANVAFHANQLGMNSTVASRVGDDELGNELRAFLQGHSLNTSYLQTDPHHPTGTVTVDMPEPNQPQYTIHTNVAWDHLEFTAELESACKQADAICFGTLAQRSPRSRETIQKCVSIAPHVLVVYDVNLRAPFYDRDTIETSLHSCHIAKFNDHEAETLADLLDIGDSNLEVVASAILKKYNAQTVCITQGDKGCLIQTSTQQATAKSKPITVADTVGAGDAFTAALTFAQLSKWSAQTTANFANQFAAEVASQQGAMPIVPSSRTSRLLTEASQETRPNQ